MARDSEHTGSADPSGNDHGQSLSDYYLVALEYIDPSLTAESTLEDILEAAQRRQEELRQRPVEEVGEELSELNEALLFAQRVLRGPHFPLPGTPAEGGTARPEDEPAHAGDSPVPKTLLTAFSAEQRTAAAGHIDAEEPMQEEAPDVLAEREEPKTESQDAPRAPSSPLATAGENRYDPRRPSLREVMAQAQVSDLRAPPPGKEPSSPVRSPAPTLPEAAAWPILLGLGLIAWQVWLALFSGWSITRFFIWPSPVNGYQLGWLSAAGLLALALAIVVVVGVLVWRYRTRTRRLTLLVNLSALAMLLDLVAWWWAARRLPGQLDGPHWWYAAVLVLAWALALVLARLHDAAVKPAR